MSESTIVAIAAAVRAAETSAASVTAGALERISERNPALNAFIAVDEELALRAAAAIDAAIERGDIVGPLAGVPLAVKDTEDTIGYVTTYGSRLWAESPVANRDSVLVTRLKAAGCVVVGKTNTPELASKGETDNLVFGATGNPHDPQRSAGGSSGGAAAAVAAGMVPLATASDGGGSIRIPASACGLPGFKPSLGRIPDGGPVPVDWHHLTTRGVMTRTIDDLLAVLDVVVGPDPTDLRSLPAPSEPWSTAVSRRGLPRRVGWAPRLGYEVNDPQIVAACAVAVESLAADGVEVIELDAVFDHDPVFAWLTLVNAYLVRSIGTADADLMDPEVKRYIDHGRTVTAQQLVAAEDACHLLNLQLVDVFTRCDLLLTPTLALDPPRLDEHGVPWVCSTYPFNLTRSPAGTMPVGVSAAGMPIGLQIVGPQHDDVGVLQLMRHIERP